MTDQKGWIFDYTIPPSLEGAADVWYREMYKGMVSYGYRVERTLYSERSDYQRIDVFDTYSHGKLLTLDGLVMLTERDEFIYHEMISHLPMQTLENARHALVIGGGDGGTVRELVKHKGLETITMVEIDEMVVRICEKYFPQLTCGLSDPRVDLRFEDGIEYVKSLEPGSLDLVLVDSTDPIGPGEVLFSREFYQYVKNAMSEKGVMVAQTENPFYHGPFMKELYAKLDGLFTNAWMYWAVVPAYIGFMWTFCYCSMASHPLNDFRTENIGDLDCKYYTPGIHKAAFSLPAFVYKCLPEDHEQREI